MSTHRWDSEPRSYWRAASRAIIEALYESSQATGLDPDHTLQLIDMAYPFGPRANLPYAMWLDERKRIRVRLGLLTDPRVNERVSAGQTEMVLS